MQTLKHRLTTFPLIPATVGDTIGHGGSDSVAPPTAPRPPSPFCAQTENDFVGFGGYGESSYDRPEGKLGHGPRKL